MAVDAEAGNGGLERANRGDAGASGRCAEQAHTHTRHRARARATARLRPRTHAPGGPARAGIGVRQRALTSALPRALARSGGSPNAALSRSDTMAERMRSRGAFPMPTRDEMRKRVRSLLPVLEWGKDVSRESLKNDVIAGLTVGCMLVPQSMAYALLAGMPMIYGLYSSFVPLVVYGCLNTSRVQAVGPVAMDAMMTASVATNILGTERAAQCDPLVPSTCGEYIALALLLAFFTGLLQMCFGVFHLGIIVNFLSHSVMSGFTSAAALVIGLSQCKYLLGVDVPRQTYAWQTVYKLAKAIPDLDLNNLPVAIMCCAIIYGLKWWKKTRYKKSNPSKAHQYFKIVCDLSALINTVVAAVVTFVMYKSGVEIPIVGDVPSGLPAPELPAFNDFTDYGQVISGALIIGLIGFLELIAIAQTYASERGYEVDTNQEFLALGAGNMLGSLFSSFPIGGSFSRTAVNGSSGAETPLSGLITAAVILLAVTALSSTFFYIPMCSLAAIVVVAVKDLVKVSDFKEAWRVSKADFAVMLASFGFTFGLGVWQGIAVGVIISLAITVKHSAYPNIASLGQVPGTLVFRDMRQRKGKSRLLTFDGVVLLRVDSELYFANCGYVKNQIMERVKEEDAHAVILDAGGVNTIDLSGLHMLRGLVEDLEHKGVTLLLAHLKEPVRFSMKKAGFFEPLSDGGVISKSHCFSHVSDAVTQVMGAKDMNLRHAPSHRELMAMWEDKERTDNLASSADELESVAEQTSALNAEQRALTKKKLDVSSEMSAEQKAYIERELQRGSLSQNQGNVLGADSVAVSIDEDNNSSEKGKDIKRRK